MGRLALDIGASGRHIGPMSENARIRSSPDDDDNAAFLEAVVQGIAAADAGRTIPYEDVRRWLLSWGTEAELPPPKCR